MSAGGNLVSLDGTGVKAEVLDVDEQLAHDVHSDIMKLLQETSQTYFAIAERLYKIRAEHLYRKIGPGYSTFEDYVGKELDFQRRKANYMTQIWRWYGIENGAHPKLISAAHEIGWTKARELVEVMDITNVDKWVEIAKSMDSNELAVAARAAMRSAGRERRRHKSDEPLPLPSEALQVQDDVGGNGSGVMSADDRPRGARGVEPPSLEQIEDLRKSDEEWQRITFHVTKDHMPIIEQAMDIASHEGDSSHKGNLLQLICTHFVSFYARNQDVMLPELLGQIERLMGISIVAVDSKKKQFVYGNEFVAKLAEMEDGQ